MADPPRSTSATGSATGSRSPLPRSSFEVGRDPLSSSQPTLPRRISGLSSSPSPARAAGSTRQDRQDRPNVNLDRAPVPVPSHPHRPHAATISTTRPFRSLVSGDDLLGVGGSGPRRSRGAGRPASVLSDNALLEDHHLQSGQHHDGASVRPSGRPLSPRADSAGSRRLFALDSLSKDELAVVETRFDLMSNDEISAYMRHLPLLSDPHTPAIAVSPWPDDHDHSHSFRPATPPLRIGDQSPLFPPSPPSVAAVNPVDHPLRVLSRTIRELREAIEKLEEENETLRDAARTKKATNKGKAADQMSIHDGLTEAISTSLTTDSPIDEMTAPTNGSGAKSVRTHSPTPSTTRSLRPGSPASSISVPFPSSPIDTSFAFASASQPRSIESTSMPAPGTGAGAATKKNNRSSWTSGLWVWSASKKPPQHSRRNGSISSIASLNNNAPGTPSGLHKQDYPSLASTLDEDEEAWRKGDGGSSPGFRAIFLATRIITPDPSSILISSDIPANSLVAYLAHSLVSIARDEGIVAQDPPDRRRSREYSRSRAASIASQDAISPDLGSTGTPAKENKGFNYGDQALAATASIGRSLLSSVSTATLRGTKAISGLSEETRPSLLSRVSSSRGFPTTAISPPPGQVDPTTSPTEETPPPSVELASIVPDESRPPTVLLSRQNLGSFFQASKVNKTKLATASRFDSDEPPLTDRYGFIYDIQHAKMLKDASAAGTPAPMSLTGAMPKGPAESEGWIARNRRDSQGSSRSELRNPQKVEHAEAAAVESQQSVNSTNSAGSTRPGIPRKKSSNIPTPPESRSTSQADHVRHRSSTLLSLNPSPAKTVTGKERVTVSARGASSLQPDASSSSVVPLSSPSASASASTELPSPSPAPAANTNQPNVSRLTISSLLDQLTELHDQQQKERLVEWDAFLKKRAKSRTAERKSEDMTVGTGAGAGLIGVSQIGLSGKGQEDWKSFTKLVRRGIPLKYRSDIWAECSGAKDSLVPGEYAEILAVHADQASPVLADIEKDVSRTFPGNVFFGGDGPGVAKLRRVLVAYSWHNPAVGYCQGMNMLAATLLLTHTDEEQAYWVLSSIIEHLLPAHFYAPSLLASRADQQVLSDLVAQLLPKFNAHLGELGVDLASITFGWFLSLFTDCLPVETLFRVWDVFFVEGHDTLFRVAIAILKLNEADLLSCESVSDLFAFIASMTARLWSADKLISLQHSYKPIIRHIDIVARCERALAALEAT